MNPYTDRVTCSVCGEPGMAWAGEGYKEWIGARFRHSDPQVCADNLERKAEDLARREKALKDKEG